MTDVQFILGRSGTGKTTRCVASAAAALLDGGDAPLVLLTPEQATYQMERAVLAQPGIAGYSRLRVLSFNRLAFWLNKRQKTATELSRLGRQMATHRTLLTLADQLTLYRDAARQPGLAAQISPLLVELQQADCSPHQITALAERLTRTDPGNPATRKWQDIASIYAEYAAFFEQNDRLSNPDAQLTQARAAIEQAAFLKGATIWVDGFSGFSVQERELLIAMARQAERVYIALCLDPTALDLNKPDIETLDPAGLFYCTEQTYAELVEVFGKCRFTLVPPVVLDAPRRYVASPGLSHLERYLLDEAPPKTAARGAVEIVCCSDPRAEADWIAGRICRLVRQSGSRYRQIAVAVPQMDSYAAYLESAFRRFGVPYFLDRAAQVKHHPLAETLQAALAAAERFTTTDVLCTLKSGLAGVTAEQIDRLERYCVKFGVDREDWTDTTAWAFEQSDDDAAMDILRRQAAQPLIQLHQSLFAQADPITASAFVRAVWRYLEAIGAQTTLAQWAADDATDTQGHRQTWAQLTAALDEMDQVFAGHTEAAQVFVSVLTDALSSLTIKLIPPTLDQVLIGSIERSRHPDIRAIFLVGATQKLFPVPLSMTDLLGQRERAAAQAQGLELAETATQQMAMRQYLAYIALTRASAYVALTLPQQDEKGAAVVPSQWVQRVAGLFTDVSIAAAGQDGSPWQSRCAAELGLRLAETCGRDHLPDATTDEARFVLHAAAASQNAAVCAAAQRVLDALRYDNVAQVSDAMIGAFGNIGDFSATRLGTFAACPYQHFARYVLRLEERPVLRFEPLDVGLFYHTALEKLFALLQSQHTTWGQADGDVPAALCERAIEQTLAEDATIAAFVRRKLHNRCIIETACQTLRRCAAALAEMERTGAFRQVASEYGFRFELDTGTCVRGKIDRVDIAEVGGKTTAVIIDYKRRQKSLNWTHFYHGLDVQLLMYLLAVPSLPKAAAAETIAGAFYLPIEENGQTVPLSEIEKKQAAFDRKARGLFDGRFADALDRGAQTGWSRYYNFAVSKDGTPYSHYGNSGAMRPEDFAAVLNYGRGKIVALADAIRSGTITAAPYRIATTSPCGHCDYKSVCRFDWQINGYRNLAMLKKEAAIERMKEESI